MGITYKDSGVDLELYEESMQRLPRLMHRTFTPRVLRNDGGFAGLFSLDFRQQLFARNYEQPVLVSGTDGVGTKLKVAIAANRHSTIGIDLVAMCVNDVLCTGAEPLFFLDYIAMGKDDPALLEQLVRGVSDGCIQGECSLIGGETAIMPDHYHPGDYELAGFCVGVVDRKNLISGKDIADGDVILGVHSSGIHSNGYSLARKAIFDHGQLTLDTFVPELQQTVADALLEPTLMYSKVTRTVLSHYKVKNVVHGLAHITGGGLLENTERILPPNVDLVFDRGSWSVPPVFPWLARLGDIASNEMEHVFNMGIGFVLVVRPFFAGSIQSMIEGLGYRCWTIGRAVTGTGKSRYAD
ncbi:MAG: phosphoribosylformylglycinamidine cyclo-ligase [Pirellula sp.]|jgi:phosphoribosylformylglycinamidine cyclo-ligase|nr:phosphoribosylformylglycinamidine cyclo-ligase [Pirellula sp.]